jgi:hypothetical protein
MHLPYFAWLVCEQRNEDWNTGVCYGDKQLQLD